MNLVSKQKRMILIPVKNKHSEKKKNKIRYVGYTDKQDHGFLENTLLNVFIFSQNAWLLHIIASIICMHFFCSVESSLWRKKNIGSVMFQTHYGVRVFVSLFDLHVMWQLRKKYSTNLIILEQEYSDHRCLFG